MARGRSARRAVVLLTTLVALLTTTACNNASSPSPVAANPTPQAPVDLTFGVYGSKPEVAAFQRMVDLYDESASSTDVTLVSWPSREAMLADVRQGVQLPDVFMASRDDIARFHDLDLNVPVFDLLDERGVSYGDRYTHNALSAFSFDDDLQCIPYTTSPMVIYYNTDLVDFDRMRLKALPAPSPDSTTWSFDQFSAAARFASRPQRGTKGVDIPATLRALAPFVYSGGGQVFDNADQPTSLNLNDGDTQTALTTTFQLLRDPNLTLTNDQLSRATPEQWFTRGKVAMIEGYRDMTPALRQVPGLNFDVMQMPSLGSRATIGDATGLCLSRNQHIPQSADFLVHAISEAAVADVASAGYVVPADQAVARLDNGPFLQPDLEPAHAGAFNAAVDSMRSFPLSATDTALNALVSPVLELLLTSPVFGDLDRVTADLDEASRSILDPTYTPSPSVSPSDSPDNSSDSSSPTSVPSD